MCPDKVSEIPVVQRDLREERILLRLQAKTTINIIEHLVRVFIGRELFVNQVARWFAILRVERNLLLPHPELREIHIGFAYLD